MSDTDSFIEEVTEEVRRDRLFGLFRKYGWIAIVAVLAIVGGTAWNEYSKAQTRATAQAAGDAILNALEEDETDARIAALSGLRTRDDITPGAQAIVALLNAAEQSGTGDDAGAQAALDEIAANGDLPEIYRQIATFKSASRAGNLSADERRVRLEALAAPGQALRVLSVEQLALIDLETGNTDAAIAKLQSLLVDAEATAGLRQRATQLIIALGAEPETLADGQVDAGTSQ